MAQHGGVLAITTPKFPKNGSLAAHTVRSGPLWWAAACMIFNNLSYSASFAAHRPHRPHSVTSNKNKMNKCASRCKILPPALCEQRHCVAGPTVEGQNGHKQQLKASVRTARPNRKKKKKSSVDSLP
jgi:hypothetical protein